MRRCVLRRGWERRDLLHVGELGKGGVPVEVFRPPGRRVGIDFVGHVDCKIPAKVVVHGRVGARGWDVVALPVQLRAPGVLCEPDDDTRLVRYRL